tara:strand:+ start:2441 stop:3253 length:813 start_codon:yes stop_codon:yes gene_type:complete
MKAFSLFLFRLVTGGYLVAWSGSKILDTESAIAFSDQLYFGYASTPTLQHGLAALGAVLGVFVVIGFLRAFSYSVQALVLAIAVAALARLTIVPPVDLASGIEAVTVLTPGLALFLLALGLLVWRKDDALSLDRFIDWRKSDLAQEAAHAAFLGAPVVVEAARADEPAHAVHADAVHDAHIDDAPAPIESHAEETHGHDAPAHEEHASADAHEEPVAHEEPAAHANGHDSHTGEAHEAEAHGDTHDEPHEDAHGHDVHAHDERKEPHHAH